MLDIKMRICEVRRIYFSKKGEIKKRLKEFSQVWNKKSDKQIFAELVFCLLTPQSKARTCWRVVVNLIRNNILLNGDENQIIDELKGVRFKNKKAKYIHQARDLFSSNGKIIIKSKLGRLLNTFEIRDWLVQNVKGVGFKEASHFLRNIGLGEDLAILDRHILKNLRLFKVIDNISNSLSRKRYLEIEKKMKRFADIVNIPISHLDLVLWYKETGEVFK